VRIGGFPRLWFGDGGHLDLPQPIGDEDVTAFEERWRAVHVRVEWLRSPRGRLDQVLPQTLERIAHNQNVRSRREHK
jgi:hypothetical protein